MLHLFKGQVLHIEEWSDELLICCFILEDYVSQHSVLRPEQFLQICSGISSMSRWIHHKPTRKLFASGHEDVERSWDAIRILTVVIRPAVLEGDLLHQSPRVLVEESIFTVVVRRQHQC